MIELLGKYRPEAEVVTALAKAVRGHTGNPNGELRGLRRSLAALRSLATDERTRVMLLSLKSGQGWG